MVETDGSGGEYGPIVFISHAHEDRSRAVEVKSVLRLMGFTGFVAHQDIEGGLQWEEEILRHLRACKGLVVLLSQEARDSAWVNQEIGVAVGTDRPIRSIGRGVPPWGLLYRWQSIQWQSSPDESQGNLRQARETNLTELYGLLTRASVGSRRRLIEGLKNAHQFDEARANLILLETLGELDVDEAVRLMELSRSNPEVLGCFKAREVLPKLLTPWREFLDDASIDVLDANLIKV